MRLSELFDAPVECRGERVGIVIDVRFVLAGPVDGPLATPEVVGLIVGRRRGSGFLGYERRSTDRPMLVNRLIAWRQRRSVLVEWADVEWADVESLGGSVELRPGYTRWSVQL